MLALSTYSTSLSLKFNLSKCFEIYFAVGTINAAIMNTDNMNAAIDAAIKIINIINGAIRSAIDSATTTAIRTAINTIKTAVNASNDRRDNINCMINTLTYISGIPLCKAVPVLEVSVWTI